MLRPFFLLLLFIYLFIYIVLFALFGFQLFFKILFYLGGRLQGQKAGGGETGGIGCMMCNLQRISKSLKKELTESTNSGLLWGVCEMRLRADPAPTSYVPCSS